MCGQRRVYGGDSRQDPARIRQPHRHGLGNAHGGRGLVRLRAALGAYAGVEALAVFVVIGSFFAYMLYMQGVKDIGSVRASLIGTVEPVSATITSAVMLRTVFLPTDLIGFAMIIVMMFLTV